MVANNPLQNLYLDVQGSTEGVKPGGDPIERVITLRNRGDRSAEIELWLEPADIRSEPLRQWGSFDKADSELRLAPETTIEVTLSFLVPLEAEPGFYGYDLRTRSPQYPGEDLRRSQQLQVTPSEQEGLKTEPKLSLSPTTSSTEPYLLAAGTELILLLTVENPSRRTDRFFVTCTDLPGHWFTVMYPENAAAVPGRVTQTDGLQLNPREIGTVQLRIHPPAHTVAGHYFPTLRLTASNRPDLVLLEIVYLTIPIDDRLNVNLNPDSRIIPSADENFEVSLKNLGNLDRELILTGQDPQKTFRYQIIPEFVHLKPGEEHLAILQPHPRHWWRQVWRMREQTIEFDLAIENADLLTPATDISDPLAPESRALETVKPTLLPALPDTVPVGKILWKARRRWLFWLLLVLLSLGLLTTLTWGLWYFLFWRPSLRPQIVEFDPTQETYQEGEGPVTLDWEITNPDKIGAIALVFDGQPKDKPQVYTLNQNGISLPQTLEQVCQIDEIENANSILATLLKFHRQTITQSPNTQVLQCRSIVPEGFVAEEGAYQFKLKVFAQQSESQDNEASETAVTHTRSNPVAIKTLKDVVVGPPAPPKIVALSATASEYRLVTDAEIEPEESVEGSTVVPSQISAQASEILSEISQPTSSPLAPIQLDWEISNFQEIGSLKLVSLDPEGSENTRPETFEFSQGIPPELQPFCQAIETENKLICNQVPTTATEVGDYVFYLTVIPKDGSGDEDIIKSSPTIPIKPPTPEIVTFTLNGQPVAINPKRVFIVNPARGSMTIELAWDVQNAAQVELLPAPGAIQGNTLTYTVSAAPGSEMITLRAVNELEEEITQTVVIEKVSYDPMQPASSGLPGGASQAGSSVLPPPSLPTVPIPGTTPMTPDDLPAAEEPPRAN